MSLAIEARRGWTAGELTVAEAVYLVALGMDPSDDRDLLLDLAVHAERTDDHALTVRSPGGRP